MGIHLNRRFPVCGGKRGADSAVFSVYRSWSSITNIYKLSYGLEISVTLYEA